MRRREKHLCIKRHLSLYSYTWHLFTWKAFKKSRRKKLTSDLSRVTYYMITCCLKSLPSVVESPTETLVVQIEFRKEDKKDNIMATSVHPDKFRGESLELEREPQELSEEDKLKVRSKLWNTFSEKIHGVWKYVPNQKCLTLTFISKLCSFLLYRSFSLQFTFSAKIQICSHIPQC